MKEKKMKSVDYFNSRVRKMTIFDVKLVQGAAIFFALVIVKIFPTILNINIWWFVVLAVLFAIRPVWVFFIRK